MELENKKDMRYEFLRSVAMLTIVLVHFLGHGGINEKIDFASLEYFFFSTMRTIGHLGVNCFVLISGFFLYQGTVNSFAQISSDILAEV